MLIKQLHAEHAVHVFIQVMNDSVPTVQRDFVTTGKASITDCAGDTYHINVSNDMEMN